MNKLFSAALAALCLVLIPAAVYAQALTVVAQDTGTGARISVPLPAASASVPINISTATTTQLVALSAGLGIYVTHWDVTAGGTGTIAFEYGTGSSCGTGTTLLTGAYSLVAQSRADAGSGLGAVLFVPPGNALCAVTVGAVQYSGSVSYAQF